MTKTTHAYLSVGILASQRVRGRVPPRFNTVLERETYYSTVSKERDVQEREKRETYKRERRERRTETEDRQARSPRERKEKGVRLGTKRVLWRSCWKSRTSFIIRILWKQLF